MAELNSLNYLNLIGYIINALITFGATSALSLPDNATLSEKYQTIITPAGWAFAIWGIIFLFQAIFAIIQMLPSFRALPMVQDGVKYWYFVTCITQSAWTFAFSYEVIWLSATVMTFILVSLLLVLASQGKAQSDGTLREYWLLRFPFEIHCGWIFAAFAVNWNVFVVADDSVVRMQIFWATISLVFFLMISLFSLFWKNPNYVIPLVLVWAGTAIVVELMNPIEAIANFSQKEIKFVQYSTGAVSSVIFLCTVARGTYQLIKKRSNEERGYEGAPLNSSLLH